MESKKQLLQLISKAEQCKQEYLNAFFKYIPEATAKEMVNTEVKKNECILIAGSPSDTVYILLSGSVSGEDHKTMGRIFSFMDFSKMYVLGDFEAFADVQEYYVSIRAEKDCRLLKISTKSYLSWIKHDENALFLRLGNVVQNLDFEKSLERDWLFLGSRERLVNYLIRLYEKEMLFDRGMLKLEKSQIKLADKIGVNVRSIQRSIAALESEKLISLDKGKVTVSYDQYLLLKQNSDEKGENHGKI